MNSGYREVVEDISSDKATPGGGAVSAMVIAHGIALARMVAKLTINREKWKSGHNSAAQFLIDSEDWIDYSLRLSESDCYAFESVMQAYRMPKGNDEEKELRSRAINVANLAATESPLEIMEFGLNVLESIKSMSSTCNSNAITDLGSAIHIIHSALECASLNVQVNITSESENSFEFSKRVEEILTSSHEIKSDVSNIVEARM